MKKLIFILLMLPLLAMSQIANTYFVGEDAGNNSYKVHITAAGLQNCAVFYYTFYVTKQHDVQYTGYELSEKVDASWTVWVLNWEDSMKIIGSCSHWPGGLGNVNGFNGDTVITLNFTYTGYQGMALNWDHSFNNGLLYYACIDQYGGWYMPSANWWDNYFWIGTPKRDTSIEGYFDMYGKPVDKPDKPGMYIKNKQKVIVVK